MATDPDKIEVMVVPPAGFDSLLQRLAGLPLFPATALRLLTLSTESATAIQEFEAAFKADSALAADLLMVANSAEFGLRARVESIQQAVTLLGLDRVHALSVTISMNYYMRQAPKARVMQPLWSHGIATAVVCEAMAAALGLPVQGLYSAGLLHDVGRLGLLISLGEPYAQWASQRAGTEDALAVEREQFGVAHTEAGAIMAQSWGFPEPLTDAIRQHHEPGTPHTEQRLRILQYACRFTSALGYCEHAGLRKPELQGVLIDLPDKMRKVADLDPERLGMRISRLLYGMSGLGNAH